VGSILGVSTKNNKYCMEKGLLSYLAKNQTFNFHGTDQEKLFHKNLKKLRKTNWIYKTKSITYNLNEYGFRNKPFNEVNWSESIVVLGCSNVEGIGLAVEDTLCGQLEKILDTTVVNLGIGGSAIDLACWNSLLLHNHYPRPKALVQVWTSLGRYTDLNGKVFTSHLPQYRGYYHRINWPYRTKWYIEADRTLWKDKLAYVEASFFHHEYNNEKNVIKLDIIDKARDLMHPGINSNRAAAEKIADQLLKQGL
jgi:hypothetical protein